MAVRVDDPGRRTRAVRLTFDPVVRCPAGTPLFETEKGSGVRCAIEQSTLTAKDDPSTLAFFCCGEYQLCTTWESEKLRIEEGRMTQLIDNDPERKAVEQHADELKDKLVQRAKQVEVTHFYPDD